MDFVVQFAHWTEQGDEEYGLVVGLRGDGPLGSAEMALIAEHVRKRFASVQWDRMIPLNDQIGSGSPVRNCPHRAVTIRPSSGIIMIERTEATAPPDEPSDPGSQGLHRDGDGVRIDITNELWQVADEMLCRRLPLIIFQYDCWEWVSAASMPPG